jgi:signal transduction histidine kinase
MTSTSIQSRNGSGPGGAVAASDGHRADIPDWEPPALLTLVVHELREPLGLLQGYLSMFEEGDLADEQRADAVAVMRAKVLEMSHLVEVLLTVSRLDAGGLAPVPAGFDIRSAVDEAVAAVSARAMLAKATIETVSPAEPVSAWADRDHAVRILVNLLANALSYSRAPARIAVRVRPGDQVEVAVRDHGTGIPTDQQERVFRRFTRLDAAGPPRSPGFGLGLPLSRELAEANDGTLELKSSSPRRGSVFLLRLPAAGEAMTHGE